MRVNVYNEELSDRVELEKKPANGVVFNGIRFYSKESWKHGKDDDDTPAVTFFFSDVVGREQLRNAFSKALQLLDDPDVEL